jgi:hypothetical protein
LTCGSYKQALMTATLALSGTRRRGTPPIAAKARRVRANPIGKCLRPGRLDTQGGS